MQRYNPKTIEPKWQQAWQESGIYQADDRSDKPKRYIMEYFPYPSGAAMHVGHVRNYTIGDVLSRHARMRGYNVLHPMGWDAFGLPAENYAIKTGISPQQAIADNTARFKKQLTQMGFSYDWSREFASSDPEYYKWTQWFFLYLFKKGLAYRKESLQWWCPVDKTVLANEQVEAGHCWRCGSEVEKKALKQWFFKITAYADRLAEDLDKVNWSDSLKHIQRNWIGRRQGAEINFKIDGMPSQPITVFTTRPDTLYGATFLVLAPEHPQVLEITQPAHRSQVENYQQKTRNKSDIERQETNRQKTGVFTGSYAINPVNNERLPIWIADYVLVGYGTGAIMAVPAHDERDFEFANKFDLPIVEVVEPVTGKQQDNPEFRRSIVAIVRDPKTQKFLSINWGKNGGNLFIGGGREDGEDIEATAIREIQEETGYKNIRLVSRTERMHHHYFAHSKNVARHIEAYALLFDLIDNERVAPVLEDDEKNKFTVEWLAEDEVTRRVQDELHATAYQLLVQKACYHGEGIMVNSGQYDGLASSEVRERIVADLAARGQATERVNYKMRDWLISRQRYWGAPIPIVHCETCGEVAVPDDQLPVVLPEMKSFEPSGDGRSPLARVDSFVHTKCPQCGGPAERETDTMDGFACSSWYFLRFADSHNATRPFDPAKAAYWLPVDDYIGGAEHAVMHLLYARFWTKVMCDGGLIDFDEPFMTLRNQGMILAPDGQKMSKSKGNTIQPDDLIEQGYGADAIRIMELFIGPWNQMANWSVEGMGGSFRFLQRVWTLAQELLMATPGTDSTTADQSTRNYPDIQALRKAMHYATKKVSDDLENLGFNTAIASLMEVVNGLYKMKVRLPYQEAYNEWQGAIETLLLLLAPFAPHITEELWRQLGHSESIHTSAWPSYDERYLVNDSLTIVVQVNGKLRAQLQIASDASEEVIKQAAQTEPKIVVALADRSPRKIVYVPGKLVNFVV